MENCETIQPIFNSTSIPEGKEKDIYLIILIPKEEEEENEKSKELCFISKIVPEIFYEKDIQIGKSSFFKLRIFKIILEKEEKAEKGKEKEIPIKIEYTIGYDIYTIKFDYKNN